MNSSAESVREWLKAGADVKSGLLLFSTFSTNKQFPALVSIRPAKYRQLLIKKLCEFAGIEPPSERPRRKFREDYPFLSKPDCPIELKILATEKISAYTNYRQAHERLFECVTLDECYRTADEAVRNFLENSSIYDEFEYYKEHGSTLGKHRVFEQVRQKSCLSSLNILELLTLQRRLKGAIWRISDEIRKSDKPHLLSERLNRKNQKEALLTEVNRLIDQYAR